MSKEIETRRTPELIAAEINDIKVQTKRQVLYNSIEIGRRLVEAKSIVEHGEWGKWLEEKVNYSKSTANNLMKIFNEYGSSQITLLGNNAKSQAIGDLSYTQAIALLSIKDEEAREKFIEENKEKIDDMSTRELKKAIDDLNKVKDDNEKLKKKAEEAEKEKLSLQDKVKKLEEESSKTWENLEKSQNQVIEAQKQTEKYKNKVKEFEEKPIDVVTGTDESKIKELKEKHKAEIEKLNLQIKTSNEKIKELESTKKETNQDDIKKLEKEKESLEEQLKEKEAREKELNEKLNSNKDVEKAAKLKVEFDGIIRGFQTVLSDIEDINDDQIKEKSKTAAKNLLTKMQEYI